MSLELDAGHPVCSAQTRDFIEVRPADFRGVFCTPLSQFDFAKEAGSLL
jgi:hypothetical protein